MNREVKILPIGGTTGVNKNMFLYETENEILIVDCGIGFPDADMLGVDILIPDFSYVLEKKDKVVGILLTHGHEDHIGAVPYLLKEINAPVYGTKLVIGFIGEKLKEHNLEKGTTLKVIDPDAETFKIGSFLITPFRVNHSVPDSLGYGIEINNELIVHVSDFKFDWTPVMDKPFEIGKLAKIADRQPTLLLSDSLGAVSKGYTRSERSLGETFEKLISEHRESQIIITTVSSNISRIQQAINATINFDRKVVLLGRSIDSNVRVARSLGYINAPEDVFVDDRKAGKYKSNQLVYIATGAYGQTESALGRIASQTHKNVQVEDNCVVMFSADPIPGSHDQIDTLIDRLTLLGANVWYKEVQDNLHVSGHGSQGDIQMLAAVTQPKYYMPIGGTVKTMRAYTNLMEQMGVDRKRVFELIEGETVSIQDGEVKKGDSFSVVNVYLDGSKLKDVDPIVIRDRQRLAEDGVVSVAIPFSKKRRDIWGNVEINSRGFVFMKTSKGLIHNAAQKVEKVISRNGEKKHDWNYLKQEVDKELTKFFVKETGRSPLILPTIVEVE